MPHDPHDESAPQLLELQTLIDNLLVRLDLALERDRILGMAGEVVAVLESARSRVAELVAESHATAVTADSSGTPLPAVAALIPPSNWPDRLDWEDGFDLTGADDAYAESNPYDPPVR